MKKLFSILVLLCECAAIAASHTGINNGFLQSDLDANGFDILNLKSTSLLWTRATNGLGSAAFTASTAYDVANAALNATNGLGSAAFHAASDFATSTTTVTIAGTSGRVTSSAGAQDLSANRTWTLDLASGIATPGTYRSATVDTYGRVTSGSNPTTFSGYGLSDTAANLFSALTTYDFSSATNLTYKYTTNIVGAANFVFGKEYWTNASASFTFPGLTMQDPATMETMVIMVTNSGASTITATINGVAYGPSHVIPSVIYCTNATVTEIDVKHHGVLWTNAMSQ